MTFRFLLVDQSRVDALYADPQRWAACALRNVAGMGRFSVDRSVREYIEHIWSPHALVRSGLNRHGLHAG